MKKLLVLKESPSFEEALEIKNRIINEFEEDGQEPHNEVLKSFFEICDKYNIDANTGILMKYLELFLVASIARHLEYMEQEEQS